jgi:hypothetical protein
MGSVYDSGRGQEGMHLEDPDGLVRRLFSFWAVAQAIGNEEAIASSLLIRCPGIAASPLAGYG